MKARAVRPLMHKEQFPTQSEKNGFLDPVDEKIKKKRGKTRIKNKEATVRERGFYMKCSADFLGRLELLAKVYDLSRADIVRLAVTHLLFETPKNLKKRHALTKKRLVKEIYKNMDQVPDSEETKKAVLKTLVPPTNDPLIQTLVDEKATADDRERAEFFFLETNRAYIDELPQEILAEREIAIEEIQKQWEKESESLLKREAERQKRLEEKIHQERWEWERQFIDELHYGR